MPARLPRDRAAEPEGPVRRCRWAQTDPLLRAYHDEEWGVPVRDPRALWEMLVLEGFQAGLSWSIILRKRPAFRQSFKGFDPAVVARMGSRDVDRLMKDERIVRSRPKILAAIQNARAYLAMDRAGDDFSALAWNVAGGRPIAGAARVRTQSEESEALSRTLKARGFGFVGPVTVYAWMQAVGIVDDHSLECFRRGACGALEPPRERPPSPSADPTPRTRRPPPASR